MHVEFEFHHIPPLSTELAAWGVCKNIVYSGFLVIFIQLLLNSIHARTGIA